jgi:DNA invertase Pin-like site-specific DNA recombinase
MKRSTKGRGLFHTRDSGGKHEMTPAKYVEWAIDQAQKYGVLFRGTPAQIELMIREGRFAEGDLFLDYDVKGNLLSRNGLDALRAEIGRDPSVSHLFIPKRDRLARPDDPLDGVQLEHEIRAAGVTIVFMDRVVAPIVRGKRQHIGDLITSLVDYEAAGAYRQELARRIIFAQIALARAGFSTGGRAPFGFRRWLVRVDGTPVRQLVDREHVKMEGHHVVWLPGPDTELDLVRRILAMLETMPACQVAAILNQEGTASPDAGRYRTKHGVKHLVSGLWHQPTITAIARNRLLVAVATHGHRSMGDQLRMTPDGPRALEDGDYRETNKSGQPTQPKVIRNPKQNLISAKPASPFKPIISEQRFQALQLLLDERGGKQRGKPRSQDRSRNPLGCRVFDLNCAWPMYRVPQGDSFRYKCGLYQQSHGQHCAHNHIDGPLATQFALSCLRQRLHSPGVFVNLRGRLRQLAEAELQQVGSEENTAGIQEQLVQVREEMKMVERNLAFAANEDQFQAVASVFEQLKRREKSLADEITAKSRPVPIATEIDAEIDRAISFADRLSELASKPEQLPLATQAIELADIKMYVSFRSVQIGKRMLNKVAGGSVTIGAAPPPVALYEGPTAWKTIKKTNPAAADAATGQDGRRRLTQSDQQESGPEETSLRNVNRGDRI